MNSWLTARNILVIRPDNIGDVVMTGPALRAIKHTSPDARITLLASPGGATAAPLLPWIDDVIVERVLWQQIGDFPFDPQRERDLTERLAARQFDAAIIFTSFSQTPHAPGYICYLAGIPLRAGEGKEFGGQVLTTELRGASDEIQQTERNLRLIEALGFPVQDRRLQVRITDDARARATALLCDQQIDPAAPWVLLHPGASAQARRYPPERSGKLARMLIERGWPVLVTGVEREQALIDQIKAIAPDAHYLIGGTSLMEYAALVERATLVICGNTLPLHLADALMRPVLGLYSGTDYESQWQPRFTTFRLLRQPTPCHPCYLFRCPFQLQCLDIAPEAVADVADQMIREPSGFRLQASGDELEIQRSTLHGAGSGGGRRAKEVQA